MDIKEIERVVASVQTAVFRNANNVAAGVLRSRFRGAGLQFREHQIYAPGDDVRFIDWKVSARSEHTYIKTFEEDRNVEICVLLDVGPSSFYGSRGVTKLQMALEITGLLFLLAGQTQDIVRVVCFLDGRKEDLPPKRGKEGLVQFIAFMERKGLMDGSGRVVLRRQFGLKPNPDNAILALAREQLSRRKEVVYLGDMLDFGHSREAEKIFSDPRMHAVRLLSPLDLKPLRYTFAVKAGRFAGGGKPAPDTELVSRFPIVTSEERYLEQFLRRIR